MNPEDTQKLYEERLGRYQAAIALEPRDRMPIATGSNYFAEVYSGNTKQMTVYDSEKWLAAEVAFMRDFQEVDVLRNNRIYAPLFDAVGCRTYKLPGRDLSPTTQFQFVEQEYMQADEYDILIKDPVGFMLERFLPRVLGEFANSGSKRAYIALLKGGMAHGQMVAVMKKRSIYLQTQCGMPQPMTGAFLAPFDVIGDVMRGLNATIMDMYRQPDNLLAACDVLVPEMANFALATADPLRRYPIFVPTHKPMFLSPEQFDTFYWPSFKKTIEILIEAGYKVRAYLEGDWSAHWQHMLEFHKGSVVCDIDIQGDIFKALEDFGHHQCVAGGIPDPLFIIGTPQEIREQVKLLCEAAGKDKCLLINGGCNIPYDTRPENYRAMIDAILEFGTYDTDIKPRPKVVDSAPTEISGLTNQGMLTPWEIKSAELGEIQGDEDLIRNHWEVLEKMAYSWIWQWVL
jgi:uroporphyrinogen-III decarboxylase